MSTSLVKTLTDGQVIILTTFFSGKAVVDGYETIENWTVPANGAFSAGLTGNARIEIIAYTSQANTTGYVRVFDITDGISTDREICVTAVSNKLTPTTVMGPSFEVIQGHLYQIHVRAEGSGGYFSVLNVTPVEV